MQAEALNTILAGEMDEGKSSRARGNEGRARVCFRRAAGWAIATLRPGYQPSSGMGNALEALRWFRDEARYDPELRGCARRLTTRLRSDHSLPFEEDPQADAERLLAFVLGEDWRQL
jgi:hypothetical protein